MSRKLEAIQLGPAIIDKINFTYHGKSFEPKDSDWQKIFNSQGLIKYEMTVSNVSGFEVLKPDKEYVLVKIGHKSKYKKVIYDCFSEIDTTIYYRSIYGETESVTFQGAHVIAP